MSEPDAWKTDAIFHHSVCAHSKTLHPLPEVEEDEIDPLFSDSTIRAWAKNQLVEIKQMEDDPAFSNTVLEGQKAQIKILLEDFLDVEIESLVGFLDVDQDFSLKDDKGENQ